MLLRKHYAADILCRPADGLLYRIMSTAVLAALIRQSNGLNMLFYFLFGANFETLKGYHIEPRKKGTSYAEQNEGSLTGLVTSYAGTAF